ncbi:hypothetical protein CORC01_02120 [Colletotrichum orchidophilum]|uniref:Uncharacterized protein n=1 Tax=Colletotrichum orchidophilum TaxID=1209926 RepID=A0A1G4BM69_9PEZI|nr:hypothetical protein CORC01_02120 [Colletotrichum orchidophilum]
MDVLQAKYPGGSTTETGQRTLQR